MSLVILICASQTFGRHPMVTVTMMFRFRWKLWGSSGHLLADGSPDCTGCLEGIQLGLPTWVRYGKNVRFHGRRKVAEVSIHIFNDDDLNRIEPWNYDFLAASDAQFCHDNFVLAGDEILRQHREAFHLRVPEQEFRKKMGMMGAFLWKSRKTWDVPRFFWNLKQH